MQQDGQAPCALSMRSNPKEGCASNPEYQAEDAKFRWGRILRRPSS